MERTRSAVLVGAVRAVEAAGARKTTMADIAARSGIAKGTLYNHFRTKEAVFAAAVEAAVERLADEATTVAADGGLAAALATLARRLSGSGALRRLREEPAALLPLLTVGDAPAWEAARRALAGVLAASGTRADAGAVDTVLRWLTSFSCGSASSAQIDAGAEILAAGLAGEAADQDPR